SLGDVKKPNGRLYANNKKDWQWFCKAAAYARHLDLVSPHALIDQRNPQPRLFANYPPELPEPSFLMGDFPDWRYPRIWPTYGFAYFLPQPTVSGYGYTQLDQPFHLELWIEKSTMDDVLSPLCRALHVNYVTSVGYQSITGVVNLLGRLQALRDLED